MTRTRTISRREFQALSTEEMSAYLRGKTSRLDLVDMAMRKGLSPKQFADIAARLQTNEAILTVLEGL